MKVSALLLALAGLGCGLMASYYWFKSSKVRIDIGPETEPGEVVFSQLRWQAATVKAIVEMSRLNKVATVWTAIAIVFSGVSGVFGNWP